MPPDFLALFGVPESVIVAKMIISIESGGVFIALNASQKWLPDWSQISILVTGLL